MYWPGIDDLRGFYSTSLGGVVRQHLRRNLREMWPEIHEHTSRATVLGLGYAVPYLSEMCAAAQNLPLAVMPAPQGACPWPAGAPERGNLSLLAADAMLPFADESAERVLLVHTLEYTENPLALLQELWRTLTPLGRLIIIVPNRRSIWARREITPFGYGHPFSHRQLRALLAEAKFHTLRLETALLLPPTQFRLALKLTAARPTHRLGRILACCARAAGMGGVLVLEAEKQRYATLTEPHRRAYRYRAAAPTPAA